MSISGRVGDTVQDFRFTNGILDVFSEEEAEVIRNADGYGFAINEVPYGSSENVKVAGNVPRQGMRSTVTPEPEEGEEAPPSRSLITHSNKSDLAAIAARNGLAVTVDNTRVELITALMDHFYPPE
jgi:hypothetical protein